MTIAKAEADKAFKTCASCRTPMRRENFSKDTARKDGLNPYCRDCNGKSYLELMADAERSQNRRRVAYENWIGRMYGITLEDYARALYAQDFKCAIDKRPLLLDINTHVDHCHVTGLFRGLLCRQCNTALGAFGHSADTLIEAARYLVKK